jgi:deoxyribose-phosphate aldolase
VLSHAHLGTRLDLARLIDHTLLRATATPAEIDRLCDEALRFEFWSVCVNPAYVSRAARRLIGSSSKVCTVISFPLGSSTTGIKVMEARTAIEQGAQEIDMVCNLGALKSGDDETFFADINEVSSICGSSNALLKVILECCYLTDEEKVRGAQIAEHAGANFVKTSTGFGPGGATVPDVFLLRKALSNRTGVKAAGGIGTLGKALELIEAGANRIGTSSGVTIMEELTV